jgi:hypothetical protein
MNFDSVANTYEHSVFNEVLRLLNEREMNFSEDEAEDIACLALNELPPHYVRHGVDTAYFQTTDESQEMSQQVAKAVEKAFLRVQSHPRKTET